MTTAKDILSLFEQGNKKFKATFKSGQIVTTVIAKDEDEAKKVIEKELSKNPSRKALLDKWVKDGQIVIAESKMSEMIKAGSFIKVIRTGPGIQKNYPAANWIKTTEIVRLIDDAPNEGTLDVLDVELEDGTEKSIYDFNIVTKVRSFKG